MTMTVNAACTVCAGTGEDPDFGGRCTMCEGFIPRRGGIGENLRARQWAPTPTRRAAAVAADDSWKTRPRWSKVGGEFLVVVPKNITAASGETVTVHSKNGEKPVVLGEVAGSDNYGGTLYRPAESAPRAPRADVIGEGFYLHDEKVFRVVTSKAGRPYAKELVGHRFEYAAGAIRELSADERVTAEVAAAYGHETNHCLFCGRELDNPESVARGIGPVCFAKHC